MNYRKITGILMLALPLMVAMLTSTSCRKKLPMTSILVQDSIRHYYPLVRGTELKLLWRIANTGETPLVINDVQPSCGCIVDELDEKYVVPPGNELLLRFTFRSDKNSGYVRHTIRLFGNIIPKGMACLVFDLNVVNPALSSPDYEEQHKLRNEHEIAAGITELVDGTDAQKGYWTNEEDYSRGYNKYYWRKGRK